MRQSLADKHFQNDPATLVLDALNGLCAHNPQLALDHINKGGRTLHNPQPSQN
jgi:hypothetical protein